MELLERDRGAAVALEALALADLVEEAGPGVAEVAPSVASYETTWTEAAGYDKDGKRHFKGEKYRVPHVDRREMSLVEKAWMSDAPVGEWHGVTTHPNGRVARLDLRNMSLRGELPPSLAMLEQLEQLDLSGNDDLTLTFTRTLTLTLT